MSGGGLQYHNRGADRRSIHAGYSDNDVKLCSGYILFVATTPPPKNLANVIQHTEAFNVIDLPLHWELALTVGSEQ